MNKITYRRHRFPAEIIQRAVWLCFRFPLSYRDVEDLLAERGVDVSYETIRRWSLKFGQAYARKLRQSRPRPDDRWHLDEVFSSINGKRMYLWRAVDSEGEVLDILADITQMTSRFAEIIPLYHRRGNCIPFAAIRWPDFGDQPSVGRPFGQICRHSDTPLLSFSPRRRFPRPTPGRVLVADHQSGSRFSGTVPSAPPPRPIGT